MRYTVGDRVRVSIEDPGDIDAHVDGAVGRVTAVLEDDLGAITGDPRDDRLYQVEFEDEEFTRMTFRHHDLERLEYRSVSHRRRRGLPLRRGTALGRAVNLCG